ncbi:response regulator transcription factor [Ileibacterium valens]|uniref:response regulator transcription factor n=1 Tax=Ileibacterium valens TaxID=1862668 RepID=UPI00259BEC2A|nr:response regulator transcription factor [Ileibacterium valens]
MEHTILVAEDEPGIREAIGIYLKSQGYTVLQAENGIQGLHLIRENDVHLAVVDIMMPEMDGITMVTELRKNYDFPVIFLSAKSEELDKINCLMIGADDYLTKPFASMELVARVRANLRRYEQILELKNTTPDLPQSVYRNGGLELNTMTKEVTVDGRSVHLTPKEFQILELFMKHPEQVFSAAQIYEAIWMEEAISTETITVHIRKLREKIEENPKKPVYIQVVWGLGYKLRKGESR